MLKVPDYVTKAKVSATDEAAAPSLNRLSLSLSNQFIFRQGGEEVWRKPTVDIVVLAIDPPEKFVNHRAYWPGKYSPDQSGHPHCASADGIRPFDWIAKPEATGCEKCTHNQPGSSGFGQGRQCKSFKLIYATFPDAIDSERFILQVPVTSCKNLDNYRWSLRQANVPIAGVKTRVSFDTKSDYAKIEFAFAGYLPEAAFVKATNLACSGEVAQLMAGSSSQAAIEYAPEEPPVSPKPGDWVEKTIAVQVQEPVESVTTVSESGTAPWEASATAIDDFFIAGTPLDECIEGVVACTSMDALTTWMSNNGERVRALSADDKTKLRAAMNDHAASFGKQVERSPVNKVTDLFQALKTPQDLSALFDAIKELPSKEHPVFKDAFINSCVKLLGEKFDPEKHSTSRNPDGYPALTKEGQYRKRRNTATAPAAPAATVADTTGVDDLFDMLDAVE